jgi:hypothetical protein
MPQGQHERIKRDLDARVEARLHARPAPVVDKSEQLVGDTMLLMAGIVFVAWVVVAAVWYWGRNPLHPGWF